MKRLFASLLALATVLTVVPLVHASVIYNSIDTNLPGGYPSVGYEATSTFELGDEIQFIGADRLLQTVQVVMTNWSCENDFVKDSGGAWIANRLNNEPCISSANSFFTHPITLKIYNVDESTGVDEPGTELISKEVNAEIKFRPSYDPNSNCATPINDIPFGGTWYDPVLNTCVHGYNTIITFDFSADNFTIPEKVIYGISYNTADYGVNPLHQAGPYNSLNYGLSTQSFLGTDVEPDTAYLNSTWVGNYCKDGTTGIFRRDEGCWGGFVPTAKFDAITKPTYTVNLLKYVDGQVATGTYMFPMSATWVTTNISSGTGEYVLGNYHGGSQFQFGAITSPMNAGATYSTYEITNATRNVLPVGTQCSSGKYLLNGYKVSEENFADAWNAPLQTEMPFFSDLQNNKYVIVSNLKCSEKPSSKEQCKNDGWKAFNSITFKNQGECVSYVNHNDEIGNDHDNANFVDTLVQTVITTVKGKR